jgi:hypothetical protein
VISSVKLSPRSVNRDASVCVLARTWLTEHLSQAEKFGAQIAVARSAPPPSCCRNQFWKRPSIRVRPENGVLPNQVDYQCDTLTAMDRKRIVPNWLLNELLLDNGVFHENMTTVTGQPNAHQRAVLNVGDDKPPKTMARHGTRKGGGGKNVPRVPCARCCPKAAKISAPLALTVAGVSINQWGAQRSARHMETYPEINAINTVRECRSRLGWPTLRLAAPRRAIGSV